MSNINPFDGRYKEHVKVVHDIFSEKAMVQYKVDIEYSYWYWLCGVLKIDLPEHVPTYMAKLTDKDFELIATNEAIFKHDIKAIEYFVHQMLKKYCFDGKDAYPLNFVHWGLTSQDIVSSAFAKAHGEFRFIMYNMLTKLINKIFDNASKMSSCKMLARTHGQPAIPTTMGREFHVYCMRLLDATEQIYDFNEANENPNSIKNTCCKFGGAIGNLAAHYAVYPDMNWDDLMDGFCSYHNLFREHGTTQVDNYKGFCDDLIGWRNIALILLDFCKDIWHYFSIGYLGKNLTKSEAGSSTMPQKSNPIVFENAEGNLEMFINQAEFFTRKLAVSRLQRDLTDSTVMRNAPTMLSHFVLAIKYIVSGLDEIEANQDTMENDLNSNFQVYSEYVQLLLKSKGLPDAYDRLKFNMMGKTYNKNEFLKFIYDAPYIKDEIKDEIHENLSKPDFYTKKVKLKQT